MRRGRPSKARFLRFLSRACQEPHACRDRNNRPSKRRPPLLVERRNGSKRGDVLLPATFYYWLTPFHMAGTRPTPKAPCTSCKFSVDMGFGATHELENAGPSCCGAKFDELRTRDFSKTNNYIEGCSVIGDQPPCRRRPDHAHQGIDIRRQLLPRSGTCMQYPRTIPNNCSRRCVSRFVASPENSIASDAILLISSSPNALGAVPSNLVRRIAQRRTDLQSQLTHNLQPDKNTTEGHGSFA